MNLEKADYYSLIWNGVDESSKPISLGIYFYG